MRCSECDKRFSKEGDLIDHIFKEHPQFKTVYVGFKRYRRKDYIENKTKE